MGGNASMTIPFYFATLVAVIDMWDSLFSKVNKTGSSLQGFSHAIKCFSYSATDEMDKSIRLNWEIRTGQ
jgi:hypothetical protein